MRMAVIMRDEYDFSAGKGGSTLKGPARNSVLSPGYADVDMSVQKDVTLGSGRRLQFRWEVFNLLNRVNFDVPNRVAFTPNFGRIFSAKPAR